MTPTGGVTAGSGGAVACAGSCEGPLTPGTLGVQVAASASCPTGYAGMTLTLSSGLNTGTTCTGCTCSMPAKTCSVKVYSYCKNFSDTSGCGTACNEDMSNVAGNLEFTLSDATEAAKCAPLSGTNVLYGIGPLTETGANTCTGAGAASKPPVTWAETLKFCGLTSTTTAGCASGQACAPATTAQRCVLLDGGTATCPSGYTPKSGPWYTGVSDTRTCAACGCSVTTAGSCGTRLIGVKENGTCNDTNPPTNQTNSRHCASVDYPEFTLRGSSTAGVCSAFSAVSGTVGTVGARTLCCK